MKLKTAKQLNRLKDESKLLAAVADLIEAGRVLIPLQVHHAYLTANSDNDIIGGCDMGCLYVAVGLMKEFPKGVEVDPAFSDKVQATNWGEMPGRAYWRNDYYNVLDWRERGLDRLNGWSIHDFVTDRNDSGIATGATVAELRRMAAIK